MSFARPKKDDKALITKRLKSSLQKLSNDPIMTEIVKTKKIQMPKLKIE